MDTQLLTPSTTPGGRPPLAIKHRPGPLRIAILAPPWFRVPPDGYGGIERVVAYLANGLAERGHHVTLFAPTGSHTGARLSPTALPAVPELIGDVSVEARHVLDAVRSAHQFDIVHDHTRLGLVAFAARSLPVVHTMHGTIGDAERRLYESLDLNSHLVAISHHQRSRLAAHAPVTVIHNAIEVDACAFGPEAGDYLLFVGRISPQKGIVEALEIAKRAAMPLLIVAKINEPAERDYFEEVVRPRMDGLDVDLLIQPPEDVKQQAYAGAAATLFPVQWDEPFGLVMIESMAAGTPVIAFPRGSVPEVVAHGKSGFVVASVDEAVEAVGLVPGIDRVACRAWVAERFGVERAVIAHERLFESLLTRSADLDQARVSAS